MQHFTPQTFKLWQFNLFGLFIPKMPHYKFYLKKKEKKIAGVAEPPIGQTGWLATTYGVNRPPQQIFFIFLNKIYDDGILGIKMLKGLNCHNLKVWEGKVSHFKL